ncbi:helix-turn-helix domain-containing protein [Geodermatophilus arenarius]|uniref:helix-turn-helix domain-containing protein n=1 Tax=Geodermatophilus arenarius TaxID=1137990 RepID=UPI0036DD2E68
MPAGRGSAPRVRASWRRSQGYGVPSDEVVPVFTGTPDTGPPLYECAHRVLTDLQTTIADKPVGLMLADPAGFVLAPIGDDTSGRRPAAGAVDPRAARRRHCVIVSGLHRLPAWAAGELAQGLATVRRAGRPQPAVLTAPEYRAAGAAPGRVVHPARGPGAGRLRLAGQRRPAAAGVREAVARADVVDVRHLAPEVLDGGARALSRLERLERDEIVRCLTEPGTTMTRVAEELGIGRATLYRKIAQYEITVPQR